MERAEAGDGFAEVAGLEEADGCDSGCSGRETLASVLESDSAECEDREGGSNISSLDAVVGSWGVSSGRDGTESKRLRVGTQFFENGR